MGPQARRAGAARRRADQDASRQGRPRRGHRGREGGVRARLRVRRTRSEGIGAFLGKRTPKLDGDSEQRRPPSSAARRAARRPHPRRRSVVALTGAGISVPSGSRTSARPATGMWANVDPMEVAHIDAWRARPGALLALLRRALPALEDKQPNGAHRALAELERRGVLDAVITQNIDMLHRKAGTRDARRGPRDDRAQLLPGVRLRRTRSTRRARASSADDRRRAALRLRRAAEAGRRAVRRVAARGA